MGAATRGHAIVVVDYHKGNLQYMERGLARAGGHAMVSDEPSVIEGAAGIVLPGVGAFADAVAFMTLTGQAQAITRAIAAGTPFLGVCLGMQLLFERGTEGAHAAAPGAEPGAAAWVPGLGVLRGQVDRLPDLPGAKVPHVGWNEVDQTPAAAACPLFAGVPDRSHFYFTHSYNVVADSADDVIATTTHARPFDSAVARGLVFGVQFHPEKSSALGLRVLSNFGTIVESFG